MDPQSVRALACATANPLGEAGKILISTYISGHRSRSMLLTCLQAPEDRCVFRVGRGRCRKRVSSVALVQHCAKHQRRSCLCWPGDSTLTHWNYHRLFQHSDTACFACTTAAAVEAAAAVDGTDDSGGIDGSGRSDGSGSNDSSDSSTVCGSGKIPFLQREPEPRKPALQPLCHCGRHCHCRRYCHCRQHLFIAVWLKHMFA